MKIVLASASPRRRELLERAGVRFEVCPASGEENITSLVPEEAVQELASVKAAHTAKDLGDLAEETLVIGADTIVVYEGEILGKPKDKQDAVCTLSRLQGRTHQVYTGVALLEISGEERRLHRFFEKTDVEFYPVTEEEILEYVESDSPMDKAGSYGIQDGFGAYVKGICGDYNNVVGLPLARMLQEMKKLGINRKGERI